MKAAANFTLVLIAIACLAALAVDVHPNIFGGALEILLFAGFLSFVLVTPILAIVLVAFLTQFVWRGRLPNLKFPQIPRRQRNLGLAILFVTFLMSIFDVPRRIAFSYVRPEFEKLLVKAPQLQDVPLEEQIGMYHVDECAVDERGGVYFRVYSCGDGIGPDTLSFGFAYKPNTQGTPFGAARFGLDGLGNDWYWFQASNDWF